VRTFYYGNKEVGEQLLNLAIEMSIEASIKKGNELQTTGQLVAIFGAITLNLEVAAVGRIPDKIGEAVTISFKDKSKESGSVK